MRSAELARFQGASFVKKTEKEYRKLGRKLTHSFIYFQGASFVKITEKEYNTQVNFGNWVCKVMQVEPPS